MSQGDNDGKTTRTARRTLLKAIGAGAAASLGVGSGLAASGVEPDDHCWYENQCLPWECPDGGGDTLQERHCCEDPDTGETECNDWKTIGCC